MNLMKRQLDYVCEGFVFGMLTLLLLVSNAEATVLFEDNFDSGTWNPEWQSKMCCQWVADGWLHTRDTDGWPRDSMAVVHDGDVDWQNYYISLKAQFVPTASWDYLNILMRTDDFLRSSGGSTGSAYQLEFRGERGWPSELQNTITLSKWNLPDMIHLYTASYVLPTDPMNLEIEMEEGNISLWINGSPIFDVVDPDPLPYGGVGIHATWEAEARFDDIIVKDIGTPATIDIDPYTLNLMSNGIWITAYIELPEGYDVNNIDTTKVNLVTPSGDTLPIDTNASVTVGNYDSDSFLDLMVKFDRATVVGYLGETDVYTDTGTDNEVTLKIKGELTGGKLFEGTDTVRAIRKK